jgi:predicted TIM-barrel fold metal-dependent hydrolase
MLKMLYSTKKIDVHHHIIPDFYRDALLANGSPQSAGMNIKSWNPGDNLKMMNRLGIQIAIVSVSEPGVKPLLPDDRKTMARQINEYTARLINQYPDRFGAFAFLPLPDVNAALEEITYAIDGLGLDGVSLLSNYEELFLGDTLFDPIFDELNRRKAVVHLHPSASADSYRRPQFVQADFMEDFTFNTTRAATNLILSGTMKRCPDLHIILSHGGGTLPFIKDRITGSQIALAMQNDEMPNLFRNAGHYMKQFYYDTALTTSKIGLMGLKEITSASHLLYGSDANFAPEIAGLAMNIQLKVSDEFDKESYQDVLRDNALKLFPRFGNYVK